MVFFCSGARYMKSRPLIQLIGDIDVFFPRPYATPFPKGKRIIGCPKVDMVLSFPAKENVFKEFLLFITFFYPYLLPGFLSTNGQGGEYLPCCCAYNPYRVARQFGFDLVNPTPRVAFPEGTLFDNLCSQFAYPKCKTIHPSVVDVIDTGFDNIPSISQEWVIYWHRVVTVFKEFKGTPTI